MNLINEILETSINWSSTNESVITTDGKVTQPQVGESDVSITLTAEITIDGKSFKRDFTVLVIAKQVEVDLIEFTFDKTLDSNITGQSGVLTGDRIHHPGGNLNYSKGVVGDGVYLDGLTGVKLPDNLIASNKYSISMWLNPEELTDFTTAFFGESLPGTWLSIVPQRGYGQNESKSMIWTSGPDYEAVFDKKLPIKAWSHLAVDVNDGSIEVYLNGVLSFKGLDFPDVFKENVNSNFALGVNFWDTPFKGTIDELKVVPNDIMGAQAVKDYYDSIMNVRPPEDIAKDILNSLEVPSETIKDIDLTAKVGTTNITWTSSDTNVISTLGKVTQPAIGKADATVKLTAKVTIDAKVFSREFTVLVRAKKEVVKSIEFSFDKTLESNVKGETGSLVGNLINQSGGNLNYAPGIVGDGVYLDGSSGILLPRNLITSNKYSISLWMNPEQLTGHTTAFFGKGAPASWISIVPQTGNPNFNGSAMVWSGEQWYDGVLDKQLPIDAWTHITVDVNKGEIEVYFNGVLAHKGDSFPDVFGDHKDNVFALGVNFWDTPFKGTIDELKVLPNDNMGAAAVKAYYDSVKGARTPEQIATDALNSLIIPKETELDLDLKTKVDDINVTWSSSNASVISKTGKVNQPAIGKPDVKVRLIASVTVDGEVYTKEFTVIVKAKQVKIDSTEFTFDKTLESNVKGQVGSLVGNLINAPGGNLKYAPGMVGEGVYLDGSTGILLPRNLITSNKYSISMWMNPEQLTGFTTAFFGEGAPASWISIVPQAGNPDWNGSAMVWSGEQWYDGVLNKQLPINAWSHITVDVNNGNIEVYYNGVLAHKGDSFPDVFGNHNDNVFALGVNFWDIPFKGTIDELKVLPNGNVGAQGAKDYYESVMASLSPEQLLEQYLDSLTFGVDGVVTENITLPKLTPAKQSMTWSSSNTKFITNNGIVTRPTATQGDQKVRLSVTVNLDGVKVTKHYDLVVKAQPIVVDKVTYTFDGSLDDSSKNPLLQGKTTGQFIDTAGKAAQYREGKVGQGVYLDGTSGIRLPDNLITGNTYSVSMWMKPEVMSDFSTTFFGLKNADSWISFTPKGVAEQAVLWSGTQWYDGLTGEQFSDNQWRHVSFTVNNGTVKVYVDGVEKHSGTNFPNIFSANGDQIFGLGVNYWDAPFKGVIDDLKIETKRVMSADEIYSHYDATVGSDRFVRNVDRTIKYNFDGNVGNARVTGDRIVNGGGSVSYEEGVIGEAVYLNGSSGLALPDNFLTSDTYSLQMWVKPESITPFTSIFFGGTSPSSWVNLPASGVDGKTMFWSGEQWYDAITPDSIPANRWSHLAVSVSKGNVSVYIDGEVKFTGKDFPDIFSSKNSFAGIGVNFWDTPFKGLIDEFEIDNNIARNAEGVKTYYETTKPEQKDFERNQEKNHHFKFENNLIDDLDETLEGTLTGHQIGVEGGNLEFIDGKEGKAVYLDGETGILLPEELITSESYSVSLWINPESITAHSTTLFGSQTESSWFSVVPQSGEFTAGNSMVWSGTQWYDGNLGSQIKVDEWSHIAFSVDKGILNAYLNGEKVFTGEGFPDIFTQEGSVFALGVNYWDVPFMGSLDELMIFDSRVLTDDEVEAIAGGKFDIDDKDDEKKKDEKEEVKTSKVPVITYIGGGVVGIGAIAYAIKRLLDAKKVV